MAVNKQVTPLTQEEIKLGLEYNKKGELVRSESEFSKGMKLMFQVLIANFVLIYMDRSYNRVIETTEGFTIIPKSNQPFFQNLSEMLFLASLFIISFVALVMITASIFGKQENPNYTLFVFILLIEALVCGLLSIMYFMYLYQIIFNIIH